VYLNCKVQMTCSKRFVLHCNYVLIALPKLPIPAFCLQAHLDNLINPSALLRDWKFLSPGGRTGKHCIQPAHLVHDDKL
jgi:hypothetical protein